jgi:hypothetical protein
MKLQTKPVTLRDANEFVKLHHRHHKPVIGHKFSIGCICGDKLVGVAIAGRPVSRMINHTKTIEVNRLCTDGTKNACSFLYAVCARIAGIMGYKSIITYTLQSESGASLRAAGWIMQRKVRDRGWNTPSRKRTIQDKRLGDKYFWIKYLN